MKRYDVLALIELSVEILMPRAKGIVNGYSPHRKFHQVECLVSGIHTYPDDKVLYPGMTVMTKIEFVSQGFFGSEIGIGDVFEVRELDRAVGKGVVKEIF